MFIIVGSYLRYIYLNGKICSKKDKFYWKYGLLFLNIILKRNLLCKVSLN